LDIISPDLFNIIIQNLQQRYKQKTLFQIHYRAPPAVEKAIHSAYDKNMGDEVVFLQSFFPGLRFVLGGTNP